MHWITDEGGTMVLVDVYYHDCHCPAPRDISILMSDFPAQQMLVYTWSMQVDCAVSSSRTTVFTSCALEEQGFGFDFEVGEKDWGLPHLAPQRRFSSSSAGDPRRSDETEVGNKLKRDVIFQYWIMHLLLAQSTSHVVNGQWAPGLGSSNGRCCTSWLKYFWPVELLTWGTPD